MAGNKPDVVWIFPAKAFVRLSGDISGGICSVILFGAVCCAVNKALAVAGLWC